MDGHLKIGKNTDWTELVLEGKYIYLLDDTFKRAQTKGKQADESLKSGEMYPLSAVLTRLGSSNNRKQQESIAHKGMKTDFYI